MQKQPRKTARVERKRGKEDMNRCKQVLLVFQGRRESKVKRDRQVNRESQVPEGYKVLMVLLGPKGLAGPRGPAGPAGPAGHDSDALQRQHEKLTEKYQCELATNSVNSFKEVALSDISRCSAGKSSEEPAYKKSNIEPASGSSSIAKAIEIILWKAIMDECKTKEQESKILDQLLDIAGLSEGQKQDLMLV
eukprot:g64501.t1